MKWHDRWRVARMALFSRVISPMISCRNVLRAFGLILTLLPITSTPVAAGELVQFDTISGDAGSLKLLGYLARPLRPEADPSPAVVILHGCGGFDDRVVAWADRLSLLWGYVALAVIVSDLAKFRETAPRTPIRSSMRPAHLIFWRNRTSSTAAGLRYSAFLREQWLR
jgi:hypothetical protein